MPEVNFDEITAIMAAFGPLDDDAGAAAMARQVDMAATTGGDAVLASWLASEWASAVIGRSESMTCRAAVRYGSSQRTGRKTAGGSGSTL